MCEKRAKLPAQQPNGQSAAETPLSLHSTTVYHTGHLEKMQAELHSVQKKLCDTVYVVSRLFYIPYTHICLPFCYALQKRLYIDEMCTMTTLKGPLAYMELFNYVLPSIVNYQ